MQGFNFHFSFLFQCSLSCGGGMRTRNVTCVSSSTSLPVDRSLCDINVMPNSIEYCNLTPCELKKIQSCFAYAQYQEQPPKS